MTTSRIVIVEDHGLVATSLATGLRHAGHEAHVEATADLDGLTDRVLGHEPDVVLLDLDLGPAGDGLDLIAPIVAGGPTVVVLTGIQDPARLGRCLAVGAAGVLTKDRSFPELLRGLERIARGHPVMDEVERHRLLAAAREADRLASERLAPFAALSRREQEVLGELMEGRTVDVIARRRQVSVATVRSQVKAIRQKLGVSSQLSAVALARQAGWQPPASTSR
ncbi:MAG: response regulator [Nitriliruptoraceae bacterium]